MTLFVPLYDQQFGIDAYKGLHFFLFSSNSLLWSGYLHSFNIPAKEDHEMVPSQCMRFVQTQNLLFQQKGGAYWEHR